ncbi:hypothetical protein [Pontibacter cellulosilyticus]|uniref:SH3 domain-containing protein n=1 Tax=Pontibacter cellulosilyticus TaxID=1720253 RepID=A0A923N3A2_9BACT|nr:hypothetical protein [Pontibacter cellulosilyticus]MBC5991369.1 hypothetical protein [Pontibacter cellulosilyticus]
MRKLLLLPVALFFGCKQAADNAVSSPPTDHSITLVEEEPKESIEDKVYVTYEADTTGLSAEPSTPLKLLLEGSFHKEEVWQHAEKKSWLAVFYENGTYYLRPTTIQIKPAYDPVADSDMEVNGKRIISGREVTSQDSNAVFFLTGLKNYKAGTIDTVALSRNILPANKSLSYTFKGKSYSIKAFGDSTKLSEHEYAYQNYGWKVSGTKKGKYVEQVLAQDEYFDDSIYTLLWAGDIDRDGTPDLLIDVSNHYNVSSIVLFLSSFAEKGKLYEKVALFETVGC